VVPCRQSPIHLVPFGPGTQQKNNLPTLLLQRRIGKASRNESSIYPVGYAVADQASTITPHNRDGINKIVSVLSLASVLLAPAQIKSNPRAQHKKTQHKKTQRVR
jgi:hypothetical protein